MPGLGADAAAQEQQQSTLPTETPDVSADRRGLLVEVQGPIGPATMDFLIDSLNEAALRNAELFIIRLDTPGGLDTSTRGIVKGILNSPVPVATITPDEDCRSSRPHHDRT